MVIGSSGADTITLAGGADGTVLHLGAGNDHLLLGAGTNRVTVTDVERITGERATTR